MKRLATVVLNGKTQAALVGDGTAELLEFADVRGALEAVAGGTPLGRLTRTGEAAADGLAFAPLVPQPDKIMCVGLNYYGHARETGLPISEHPLIFAKFPAALIGAADDIYLPPESERVDWEVELALVIGTPTRRVSPDEAWSAVGGYTVINDISMRDWQKHTSQMTPGKTFEHSTPVGPWLVAPDEIDHARDLRVTCRVDDDVRQDAQTSDMIFDAGTVVSYLSHIITLLPGDLIALGTPAGVGSARTPQLWLKPGEVVITEIEGIGSLRNTCVAEKVQ